MPPGGYAIQARGYDLAGNVTTTNSIVFKLGNDNLAPTATITVPPMATVPAQNPNLSSSSLSLLKGACVDAEPTEASPDRTGMNYVRIFLKQLQGNGNYYYWNSTNSTWNSSTSYYTYTFTAPDKTEWS